MIELLFSLSLFLTGGNIIDTKLRFHKYDKDNYKDIFYLKDKGFHADWKANNLTFNELFSL